MDAHSTFVPVLSQAEGCPGVTPRKRLHSAEDARCSSRPAPEGAGSVSPPEAESERRAEQKGSLRCHQCQRKVAELKKQALSSADPLSLKVCGGKKSLYIVISLQVYIECRC